MKKDKRFIAIVIVVSILFLITIGTSFFFLTVNSRFSKFISKVNMSTIQTDKIDLMFIINEDGRYKAKKENIYRLYSWLIVAGPGRERLFEIDDLDKASTITYTDGSSLVIGEINKTLYVCYKSDDYKHIFLSDDLKYDRFYQELLSISANKRED